MDPGEIDRRDAVMAIAVGTAVLVPLIAAAPPHLPKFFTADELELLAALAEMIIPQTDTPGARAARVHEHIDLVLSEETPEVQKQFRAGLARLKARPVGRRGEILAEMSIPGSAGHEFFLDLRRRTVFAYYTSEIGLHQELNYSGHQVLHRWPGCPHADHHGDEA